MRKETHKLDQSSSSSSSRQTSWQRASNSGIVEQQQHTVTQSISPRESARSFSLMFFSINKNSLPPPYHPTTQSLGRSKKELADAEEEI